MANNIFIDANVFIALLNKSDALHEKVLALWNGLEQSNQELITSHFVINEVITVLSMRVSKQLALSFANTVYNTTSVLRIIRVNEEIELEAISFLKTIKSKNISFCDCTTLAILALHRIGHIATFDKDFKIAKSLFKIIQ